MKKNPVLEYIDKVIVNVEKHLQNKQLTSNETEKLKLELRIEVLEELRNRFEWVTSSEEDKQSKRIFKIAKDREAGFDVKNQLIEVNLYSKIKEVLPYIQAVSYKFNNEEKHLTEDLINFCERQLELIDSSLNKNEYKFLSKEEIEYAFKNYTELIKTNRIPSLKVYYQPEVTEKIGELYETFKKLYPIA